MVFPCRKRLLFQIKRAAGSTNEQSFTCSALLCSALLCSALLSVYGIKFKACQPLIFKRLRAFFDEKSRGMYSNHPGEKQRQNLAVSNRLTQLASVALRRRFAPGLLYSFRWLDYSILPAKSKMFAASYIIN